MHLSPAAQAQSAEQVLQFSPIAGLQVWLPQEALATQVPDWHRKPAPHPGPHSPPQPSSPHCLPAQFGVQHAPALHRPVPQVQSPGHDSQVSPASHCPLPQYAWPTHCPN
jgi:hypothetical protein